MNEQEALIIRAAADVLVDGEVADDLGPRLTCTETEILARLIELALGAEYAKYFIKAHAQGDDEGDDHYGLAPQ